MGRYGEHFPVFGQFDFNNLGEGIFIAGIEQKKHCQGKKRNENVFHVDQNLKL